MRPPQEPSSSHQSATPIYDALYAEYRSTFRALPGDRSGEEDLGFAPFGLREQRGTWERVGEWERVSSWDTAGRQEGTHLSAPPAAGGSGWGRGNLPAALPPGPRDNRGPRG